jgi:hypothetical protein
MRTQRRVFEKLSESTKVELASERIELSLADDFKKLSSKAIKSGSNSGGDMQDWLDKLPKLLSALKESLKDQQNVISLGEKIKKEIKELGVKLPSNIAKEIKGAEQWESEIKTIIKKAQGFKL